MPRIVGIVSYVQRRSKSRAFLPHSTHTYTKEHGLIKIFMYARLLDLIQINAQIDCMFLVVNCVFVLHLRPMIKGLNLPGYQSHLLQRCHAAYVATKDITTSPRFSPYDVLSRCMFSTTLTNIKQWLDFTHSRSHAFRYEKNK